MTLANTEYPYLSTAFTFAPLAVSFWVTGSRKSTCLNFFAAYIKGTHQKSDRAFTSAPLLARSPRPSRFLSAFLGPADVHEGRPMVPVESIDSGSVAAQHAFLLNITHIAGLFKGFVDWFYSRDSPSLQFDDRRFTTLFICTRRSGLNPALSTRRVRAHRLYVWRRHNSGPSINSPLQRP